MAEEIKKMRYFNNLFLEAGEFQLEQDYHVRMRRMHNSYMHTAGIVWGLDVLSGEANKVAKIQPGMALDRYYNTVTGEYESREVVITQPYSVDLTSGSYAGGETVYIWINYQEKDSDNDFEKGGGDPIHILETAIAGHSTILPEDINANIILCRIVLDSSGNVIPENIFYEEVSGTPLRTPSGAAGNQVKANIFTITDPAISENFAYLDGRLFSDGNRGFDIVSEKTRVTGLVEMDSDVTLHGNETLDGNMNIGGDLNVQGSLTVHGTVTSIETQNQVVSDNIVVLNSGQSGSEVSRGSAGFEVDRGDGTNFRVLFDENLDRLVAGFESAEVPLATSVEMDAKDFLKEYYGTDVKLKVDGNYIRWRIGDTGDWLPFA